MMRSLRPNASLQSGASAACARLRSRPPHRRPHLDAGAALPRADAHHGPPTRRERAEPVGPRHECCRPERVAPGFGVQRRPRRLAGERPAQPWRTPLAVQRRVQAQDRLRRAHGVFLRSFDRRRTVRPWRVDQAIEQGRQSRVVGVRGPQRGAKGVRQLTHRPVLRGPRTRTAAVEGRETG